MADTTESKFDAGRQHIGLAYAKGLFGAADKNQQAAAVLDELESLQNDVLNKLPSFRMTLTSPRVATEDKIALLDKAFRGKMSAVLLNFLKVVANHGRLDCLPDIVKCYRQLVSDSEGKVEVTVRAAYPLSNPLRERIAAKLGEVLKKKVTLQLEVDPELLGGLVVRIGDTLYDGSLATQLQRMKSVTLEHTTSAFRDSLNRFTAT
jgi:F-type H+-transporting ATPase subunit delta